ncbi:hypothetical protein DXT96_13425 [Agrobacterium sp. ICMP 6402]|uniref:hypothetical protein n=1 Tax=Agrobacterium sp. ICMP 6402 TaxID=2292443 RepID=UPI0012958E63|nr:hypothetical protein [Agrobacterium sp. ICMP 6402]MQB10839.1 hypothetical protein [Agrobacterium sp. ICMP 6402]
MFKTSVAVAAFAALLSSCVQSSTMRVSKNQMIIQTSAEAMCGSVGAARAAQKQAAVETIKAGYDRYIITSAAAANNVTATQMPGQYNTYGTINSYGHYGTVNATTTYTPGPIIYGGSHDQSIGVIMFKDGEPGSNQAISAREVLGPKWAVIVKDGVNLCN